jgi:hypothetical protein
MSDFEYLDGDESVDLYYIEEECELDKIETGGIVDMAEIDKRIIGE